MKTYDSIDKFLKDLKKELIKDNPDYNNISLYLEKISKALESNSMSKVDRVLAKQEAITTQCKKGFKVH